MNRRLLAFLALTILLLGAGCVESVERRTAMPTPTEPPEATTAAEEARFATQRRIMVETQIRARGVTDEAVLAVMAKVPRHRFISRELWGKAYGDHPLPIGEGQTISQPYIVALMTQHLRIRPGDRVLEIGTGSGYQAAVLAELTDQVYTIEIIDVLAKRAAERLTELGYRKVHTKIGDGYFGWEEYAPFDAIIVTAAPDHVPQPLVRQLKDGGRLVIPVGPLGSYQTLWLIEKKGDQLISTNLGDVIFVPLQRGR
ncbi:MAG: protein-L-isoaspartate(D-aspartate) O-methyltransferase [Chloroflexi bacterium]|nr:protein-L-isoaspartate(D-aspartate) O-methyltransferase [Chloroflexota bacterium]MCL5074450.1 protein-L-isoaspartate(D-aspartate) O-methyltransferase [Chloroflexota bacterium]